MWAHISELPEPLRRVLDREAAAAEHEAAAIIQAATASIRSTHLSASVPALCRALRVHAPELNNREVFQAVSLRLGLSAPHVRDLFYRNRR